LEAGGRFDQGAYGVKSAHGSLKVFLIHVRDPQFYAIPSKTRGKNGRIQVMGFPPIGIMSLSSVLKRAGHDVRMFDQANPDTPNDVILARRGRIIAESDNISLEHVGGHDAWTYAWKPMYIRGL
jgi:hypothetical protein